MRPRYRHFLEPKRSALLVYLGILAYFLLLLTLARLAFLGLIYEKIYDLPLNDIFKAFYIGFRFDARLAAIITFPVGLILSIPPVRRLFSEWRKGAMFFYLLVLSALWLLYIVDYFFYDYLGERLNSTIIELAVDLRDGIAMIWQSYPVVPLGLLLAALILVSFLPLVKLMKVSIRELRTRKMAALSWITGFLIFAVAAFGQISTNFFPLRWSQAYFTTNPDITALGLNPAQNLYDTYSTTKDDGFNIDEARRYYPVISSYLGVDDPDPAKLSFARHFPASGNQANRPNIVILILESFSWPKSSLAPGPANHTPFMKSLSQESVYFPNFYANARTTARGVFSTITGVPDVTQSSTGSRNQRVINQRVIGNEFDGYEKYYLLGGNTNWANIRGIIGNNIEGVKIIEEGHWKASNIDVWGIHDYDLLMESHELLDSLEGPFLAVIQTASFHKPFTIPDTVPFGRLPLDRETQENYGLTGVDEYNAFRFFDFALQTFFERAKSSKYFENTIFILFGDHGITEAGSNTTGAYRAANLYPWHVPLMIYAPGMLAPELRQEAASQADVFPTAAGLAGIEYTNWTLGRDLFGGRAREETNAAFISGKKDVPIRLVMDGYCFVDNRAGGQYLYKLSEDAVDYKEAEPERFARMRDLAWAYQVSAKYLLYNNRK